MMLQQLASHWWVFLLRGVLAILFGIGAFLMPGISLAALVLVYGAYTLTDGVVGIAAAFGRRASGEGFPWSVFFIGLTGIVAGLVTFAYPGLTARLLLFFIAAWHIVRGVFEVVVAIRLRKEIEGEGWLIAGGLLSIAFGVFLYARPGAGALALMWMVGSFAIVFGIIAIALGFRLKGLAPAAR